VKALSGGERNRLLLAKIFTQPANLLVLDEPTNDLDVDTLELLEDLLAEYDGTLLLVSHDRAFLDNVVTSTIVFEGDGHVGEYVGGYEDWLRQRKPRADTAPRREKPAPPRPETTDARAPMPKKKLGYKEQRELDALPGLIETLEREQRELEGRTSQPEFYRQDKNAIAETLTRLATLRTQLEAAYARWQELETAI
jgi:ATP-binding cassette subfamily F protein uup